jgi:hypothetical protein
MLPVVHSSTNGLPDISMGKRVRCRNFVPKGKRTGLRIKKPSAEIFITSAAYSISFDSANLK